MISNTRNNLTPVDFIDILQGNAGGFELPDFEGADSPPDLSGDSNYDEFVNWFTEPANLIISVLTILAGVLVFKNV